MPHNTPEVTCPKCGGCGKIRLTPKLANAYHFIRKHPGASVKEYHEHLLRTNGELTLIAAQIRLNTLCEIMVAVRIKKSGRFRYYEAKHATTTTEAMPK